MIIWHYATIFELFGLNHLSDLPKIKEIDLLMNDGEIPPEKLDETK